MREDQGQTAGDADVTGTTPADETDEARAAREESEKAAAAENQVEGRHTGKYRDGERSER